jgi:hypothetical protein
MEELQTVVQEFKDVDPERERKGIDMWDVCTADNLVAYDMNNQGGIFPRFSFGVKGDTKRLKRFAPDCKRIETLQIKKSIISRWYSDKDSGTVWVTDRQTDSQVGIEGRGWKRWWLHW